MQCFQYLMYASLKLRNSQQSKKLLHSFLLFYSPWMLIEFLHLSCMLNLVLKRNWISGVEFACLGSEILEL